MPQDKPSMGGSGWDPELVEALSQFLYTRDPDCQRLDAELRRLEASYQETVYSELIHLLTHLRFSSAEAREHWQRIMAHAGAMQQRLGTPVDLRVALVSYFVEVARKLENPTVIELRLLEQTQAMAYRDELTGLRNFRFFAECLAQEILRSDKFQTPLSLVMIDIDDFKTYNDVHGHATGNEALAEIGRLIAGSVRKVDVVARYGGEEFAIIAPSTMKVGAQLVAERARQHVESHFAKGERSLPGRLTVSMGISTYPADARNEDELVRCADRALYLAKTSGKNQVRLFSHSRRSFLRIPVALEGRLFVMSPDPLRIVTLNISEGGMRFRCSRPLAVGALVDATLEIPTAAGEIALVGRVVQSEAVGEEGETEAAIRIVDMGSADRRTLIEYLEATKPPADAS